jgi:hypothetical protein
VQFVVLVITLHHHNVSLAVQLGLIAPSVLIHHLAQLALLDLQERSVILALKVTMETYVTIACQDTILLSLFAFPAQLSVFDAIHVLSLQSVMPVRKDI